MEVQIAGNRLRIGKKLREYESGQPDELTNKQERRKNEPRAAEKRPKRPERHIGGA